MSSSSILALIPARGGSKGIPGKNARLVAGKPLVAHSIEQARQTAAVDRVVVSTDDEIIAGIARELGAAVIHRPADISGDEASSESALIHALDHLEQEEGYVPELVLFLQATSPLRQPHDLARAIDTLHEEQADSLFSACPVHGFVWRLNARGLNSVSYDFENRLRRQDLGEDLLENGSIYLFKPWVLRRHGNRLGGRIAVHRMDPLDSFQIDEPEDLPRMEQLFQLRRAAAS